MLGKHKKRKYYTNIKIYSKIATFRKKRISSGNNVTVILKKSPHSLKQTPSRILYVYIMSFNKLLLSLSPERENFVYKIDNEMRNDASANSDIESRKDYFFSLVKKNKELSENEKEYCKEEFIYQDELQNARDKMGKPKECNL